MIKIIREDEIPANNIGSGNVATFDPLLTKKDLIKRVQKILKKKSLKESKDNSFKFKKDRIKNEIADKGYYDGRTKGYMAHVNPKHFVHSSTNSDAHVERIKQEAGKFDHEEFHKQQQTPTLYVQKKGNSHRVVGHEGRHRMQALADAGHTKVPVVVKFSNGAHRTPKKKIKLKGEHRGEFHVHNATPINHDHSDTLHKHFSE